MSVAPIDNEAAIERPSSSNIERRLRMSDRTTPASGPIKHLPREESPAPLHGAEYASPVLINLHDESRPNPSPACETCPASMWHTTNELLKCFCTRMHVIAWQANEPPIMTCDGREAAIEEMLEMRAAQEAGA